MSADLIINKWLVGVKVDLIKNYDRLGLRASGDWAESLEIFQNRNQGNIKAGITGNDYTQQLENGRRPNKNSSEEDIKKWVGWA